MTYKKLNETMNIPESKDTIVKEWKQLNCWGLRESYGMSVVARGLGMGWEMGNNCPVFFVSHGCTGAGHLKKTYKTKTQAKYYTSVETHSLYVLSFGGCIMLLDAFLQQNLDSM